MIGFIILLGLVVNNAILLVHQTRAMERHGLPRRTAVAEAVGMRLRPILMSTLTSIFGMLPLLLVPGGRKRAVPRPRRGHHRRMCVSAAFTLLLLPSLLRIGEGRSGARRSRTAPGSRRWPETGTDVEKDRQRVTDPAVFRTRANAAGIRARPTACARSGVDPLRPGREPVRDWPVPTCIISDGPYGVSGYPGDSHTAESLSEWYEPHVKAWSERSTPRRRYGSGTPSWGGPTCIHFWPRMVGCIGAATSGTRVSGTSQAMRIREH